MNDFLKILNPDQREAVLQTEGFILVNAGAGSGKTLVLTCKVAYLLSKGIKPHEILAVTFTNKAADEMKERVIKLVGKTGEKVWISTFHSFCAKLLRFYAKRLGYTPNYTIFDEEDSKRLIKEIIKEGGLSVKPELCQYRISLAKNKLIPPEEFPLIEFYDPQIKNVYQIYQRKLKELNAMDFDDLLFNAVKLLSTFKDIRESMPFRYILVDEYQDTNYAQFKLLTLLTEKCKNLTVVGDEDQSIYGWRGAEIDNILNFPKIFKDVKIINLEKNYRSTEIILRAASAVIKNNKKRLGKNLYTDKRGGKKIKLIRPPDPDAEAQICCQILKQNGISDTVILYRMHHLTRPIEEMLIKEGIPYKIIGGFRFYERKEIKDLIAFLKIVDNPQDGVSLRRVLELLPNIGKKTVDTILNYAERKRISPVEALNEVHKILPSAPKIMRLRSLHLLIKDIKERNATPYDALIRFMESINYLKKLKTGSKQVEAEDRIENVKELLRIARPYDTISEFLQRISLYTDVDRLKESDSREKVILMTAHNAKGLEFKRVILIGLTDGCFPHRDALYDEDEMEEERRLFYVALTRAKEEVFLLAPQVAYGFPRPLSRFVKEIPEDLIDNS